MTKDFTPTRRQLLAALSGLPALAAPAAFAATGSASALPLSAPVFVGKVGLDARDAEALAAWYERVVGLARLSTEGSTIRLGAGDRVLLEITEAEGLILAPPQIAGLYHTAFLLPTRGDLGRWALHAMDEMFPVTGAADHLVSEAIYLTDPEGNGVEIYADRAADDWVWSAGQVEMDSLPLDVEGLLAPLGAFPTPWTGAPVGTVVGHVHLKVGDATAASSWWQERFDFDQVRGRRDAAFLSTGGYHHHIAVNEWMSAGAGMRPEGRTGLAFVELESRIAGAPEMALDAWGTEIRVMPTSA